ncbi:MAG: hypothetical protein FVQ79_04250 [Planctomycetes bacterium]|nr:hypothetical protein [Planctomycetota bacterium]
MAKIKELFLNYTISLPVKATVNLSISGNLTEDGYKFLKEWMDRTIMVDQKILLEDKAYKELT